MFFTTYLLDRESAYILAGDETIVSKSGQSTYGLSRFFSSVSGKTIPGLAFLSLSLVSVKQRRSYPLLMEQIVRRETRGLPSPPETSEPRDAPQTPAPERNRGRPKGSRNRNKTEVELSDTLKHLQTMIKALLRRIDDLIPVRYLVLDGYFGHNPALQMTQQCGLALISKLRINTALYFPSTLPYTGRGRPRLYGQRFNPQQIDAKYRVSTQTHENITTEVYQATLLHKKFPEPLNVVCILKTHLLTEKKSHVLLFSSDLALDAETMIDYYALRFQIEFNFRDAKQFWGLEDFMNVNEIPVKNAANLSMFMVNVSAKLLAPLRLEHSECSVLDLKAGYRGMKYLQETLKMLPQKPEPIVIDQIAERLGSIGAIHYTSPQIRPG